MPSTAAAALWRFRRASTRVCKPKTPAGTPAANQCRVVQQAACRRCSMRAVRRSAVALPASAALPLWLSTKARAREVNRDRLFCQVSARSAAWLARLGSSCSACGVLARPRSSGSRPRPARAAAPHSSRSSGLSTAAMCTDVADMAARWKQAASRSCRLTASRAPASRPAAADASRRSTAEALAASGSTSRPPRPCWGDTWLAVRAGPASPGAPS